MPSAVVLSVGLVVHFAHVCSAAEAYQEVALPSGETSSLFWSQEERIVGFRNFDTIYTTRPVDHGTDYLPLVDDPQDFSELTYTVDGATHTLEQYLERFHVAGILVAKGDRILLERYRLGHTQTSRWVSYSVAKSITSLLIGAAIRDGFIENLDEPVTDYLPRLKGSAYERTTIRHLLQMASGVAWNESYTDPTSDVALAAGANGIALYEYLANLPADAEPGTKFNYNTGETNLVGSLLRSAIGNNASTYLGAKIWRPMMEHAATWTITADVELGGCCINATLRDYARLGIFAMRGGVLPDGTKILPDGWMQESTKGSPGNPGYGYLWWLWDGGAYAALGIFGQVIWIDPRNSLVLVTHSAAPTATSRAQDVHLAALIDALRRHVPIGCGDILGRTSAARCGSRFSASRRVRGAAASRGRSGSTPASPRIPGASTTCATSSTRPRTTRQVPKEGDKWQRKRTNTRVNCR